jgi:integrase/recombinase XerD
MSFAELLEKHQASFFEHLRVHGYSEKTLDKYRQSYLHAFFENLRVLNIEDWSQVTRETMQNHQRWLLKERGITMVSVLSNFSGLRKFFDYLERTNVVAKNPCTNVILPRVPPKLPNILTRKEVQSLLNAPDIRSPAGVRNKAILELFYSSAIRLGEMKNLQITDLDISSGILRINNGKFSKDRVVFFAEAAAYWLKEYLKVRMQWAIRNPTERALWLCPYSPHHAIKAQAIQVMVNHYAKELHFEKPVYPHLIRHSFSSQFISNGGNIFVLKKLLGHSWISSTQVYTQCAVPELVETLRLKHPRSRVAIKDL